MKLMRNPEAAKLFSFLGLASVLLLVLASALCFLSLRHFNTAMDRNNAAIVGAITDKYPEAEEAIIAEIGQANRESILKGEAILEKYGLESREILPGINATANLFQKNMVFFLLLAAISCGTFSLIFSKFLKKQYSDINQITEYTREIAGGKYPLDIRDNNEGDISILKNEIYKITTTLKEQGETLRHDKLALAASLADISHQLKTPMTSLFVLRDLLHNEPSPVARKNFLKKMDSQLKRIEWLVSSLLKLSKLDAGTVTIKKESVNLKEVTQRALESLEIPLDIKRLAVRVQGDDNVAFTGDFNWTCEALINILKNCIEHTPEKGLINLTYAVNPIYTVITVSDSGVGIDKQDIPYIFNRFYKGKNAGGDSVGIGLAMAKAIVLKQGGDITVKSERGKGSTFTIKFFQPLI